MRKTLEAALAAARMARLALEETLWTTRCVICDMPGSSICDNCRMLLPYIDLWRACPRCGAPYGMRVCTECNSFMLHEAGRRELPYERCVSVIEHRGEARSIVTCFKDAGERSLARDIGLMMARYLPPSWLRDSPVITYVPADARARRRRGFDHMQLVARQLQVATGLKAECLLVKEASSDQRGLTRLERFHNMAACMKADHSGMPPDLLLVDDVLTTGATLFASCDALREAGARRIRCATFGRVL